MRRLAVILLLVTACAHRACSRDEASLRAAVNDFVSAVNALDADKLASFFEDDATAFLPVPDSPSRVVGRAAIAAEFHRFFDPEKKTSSGRSVVAKEVDVRFEGDVAIVTFDAGSGTVVSRRSLVFACRGGVWKIVHLHASNIRR
jgi:uncharacterized protein (TIGR02246 family)